MTRKLHDRASVIQASHDALAYGGERHNWFTTRHNAAGDCENPVYREMDGGDRQGFRLRGNARTSPTHRLELFVRCRRCPPCLKKRAAHWRYRAMAEIEQSERTWFGTFTYKPELQYLALLSASAKIGDSKLADDDYLWRTAETVLYENVKLYFKRLRKAGIPCRYLVCTEAHKSGKAHHHVLIHCSQDTTWRDVSGKWDAYAVGFSKFVLADKLAASYVTKYLTKSIRSRIRSSFLYGKQENNRP